MTGHLDRRNVRTFARLAEWTLLALAASLSVHGARAQKITTTWNTTNGSWFTSSAWTAGLPSQFVDYSYINNGATVQITAPNARGQFVYLGSTLNTSGTLEVMTGGSASFTTLVVGGLAATGTLRIMGGGTVTSFGGPIGSDYLGIGDVIIDGVGSRWSVTSSQSVIGGNGTGTLQVQNGATYSVGGGTGSIELAHHPIASGTLKIGSGGMAGIINAAEIFNGDGAATVIFNHNEPNYIFTPILRGYGTYSGSFTVRHEGPGTTVLTANHEMAGETIVSAGKLIVNGSIFGSLEPIVEEEIIIGYSEVAGEFSTMPGGILGGSGFIKGKANNRGTLAPGTSAGILRFGGDLNLTSEGTVAMELGGRVRGSQYDGVDLPGVLTLGGTLSIALINGFTPSLSDTFHLFDGFTSTTGAFDQIVFANPAFGGAFNPETGNFTVTAVPEPTVLAHLLIGAAATLLRLRKAGRRSRQPRA